MQSKDQVVILGLSIFEKSKKTVQSNRSANKVTKKRPPSYFDVAAWTLALFLTLQCSGYVQSNNGVDLVEVISRRRSNQTIRPIK